MIWFRKKIKLNNDQIKNLMNCISCLKLVLNVPDKYLMSLTYDKFEGLFKFTLNSEDSIVIVLSYKQRKLFAHNQTWF